MTKELLEARKATLEASRAQNAKDLQAARERVVLLQATDHTINGAIQDCEHWLENLPPDAPDPSQPTNGELLEVLAGRKAKREGAAA